MNIFENGILFKGFVETRDKKCIEKFKNRTDFKTFEQVQSLPGYAGVLEETTILIDVDNEEESNILFEVIKQEKINCMVVQTTRGKHFYFKTNNDYFNTNKTHCKLALNLTADIKLGSRNSYGVLKHEGIQRKVIYQSESIDVVPKWLIPVKCSSDFKVLDAGDGRNQALFNYILTLQNHGFSVDEGRDVLRKINKYVLIEPLAESELEVIMRDEAFAKPVFFKGTKFLHDEFAVFLKNKHNIIRHNGNIMIYQDGVYDSSIRTIEKAISKEIPSLKAAQRKEVLLQLNLICDDVEGASNHMIAFRNGVLNINTGELLEFSPSYIVTNKINWDYNANAYFELTDKTLNKISCEDVQIRELLEEMIGSCFYRSNTLAGGKAFILTGGGSNGKSTLLSVIRKMLGNENFSALDLKNLNDRFSTVRMYQKLANIGDDISDEFNPDISTFKKIVTGDSIEAEQKGQPKFEFEPYCKLIFSANNIPRMKDKTGAAQRRLIIIPFNAQFSEADADYDPEIRKKLSGQESMEYLIKIAVQGLKRVLKNRQFTKSDKVQQELNEYAERNNPILSFIKDCEESEVQIINEPVDKTFEKYQGYCINNGFIALAKNEFSKQMQRQLNIKTDRPRINGKRISVFVEQ